MIWIDGQQYWLYAAVGPATNEFPQLRLYATRAAVLTERLLGELNAKHDVKDAVFLVGSEPRLQTALERRGLAFRLDATADATTSKVYFKKQRVENDIKITALKTPIRKRPKDSFIA